MFFEYGSNGDRSKTLSVEEYLNKMRLSLQDIIIDPTKLIYGKSN